MVLTLEAGTVSFQRWRWGCPTQEQLWMYTPRSLSRMQEHKTLAQRFQEGRYCEYRFLLKKKGVFVIIHT